MADEEKGTEGTEEGAGDGGAAPAPGTEGGADGGDEEASGE